MRRIMWGAALVSGVLLVGWRAMAVAPADMEPSSVRTFSAVTLQISTNSQGLVTAVKMQGLGATYQVKTNGLPWDIARFQNRIVDVPGEVSAIEDKLWITVRGTVKINEKAEAKKREDDKKREEARKKREAKEKEEARKRGTPAKGKK